MSNTTNNSTINTITFKFGGMLGMFEMERAAERIQQIMATSRRTTFGIDDFETKEERTGFVELVFNSWLEKPSPPYNGSFKPTAELLTKINKYSENDRG